MGQSARLTLSFLLILLGISVCPVNADSWGLPKKRKYHSPNKKHYLEVVPKKLNSQLDYFEDKVEGRHDAGAVKGTKNNRARAAFYSLRADGSYSRKSEFLLVNEVSPVSAIVANGGRYAVTFDNWHGVGYGDDVVVIYRADGSLVKKFGLADLLTEGDLQTLPRSTSSIWWGGNHYLDEAKGLLVLRIVSNGGGFGKEAKFHELKIELATGQPIEPKRDLFPQLRVSTSIDTSIASELTGGSSGKVTCISEEIGFDSPSVTQVSPETFFDRAKGLQPLPGYPVIAQAARVQGTITLEILVSRTGDVVCARRLAGGPPLLEGSALSAVMKWKFEPFVRSGEPVWAVGRIALNFKLTETWLRPDIRE